MRETKVEVLAFSDRTQVIAEGGPYKTRRALKRTVTLTVAVNDDQLSGVEALELAAKAVQRMPTTLETDDSEDESDD
jgi:hypothetical protein